jgi:hypothetical protein
MAHQNGRDMGKFLSFKWAILLKKGLRSTNLEDTTIIIAVYRKTVMILYKIMVTQCTSRALHALVAVSTNSSSRWVC